MEAQSFGGGGGNGGISGALDLSGGGNTSAAYTSSLGGAGFSFTLPVFDAQLHEASLAEEDARASLESEGRT